jgi:hypothetical protein
MFLTRSNGSCSRSGRTAGGGGGGGIPFLRSGSRYVTSYPITNWSFWSPVDVSLSPVIRIREIGWRRCKYPKPVFGYSGVAMNGSLAAPSMVRKKDSQLISVVSN